MFNVSLLANRTSGAPNFALDQEYEVVASGGSGYIVKYTGSDPGMESGIYQNILSQNRLGENSRKNLVLLLQ